MSYPTTPYHPKKNYTATESGMVVMQVRSSSRVGHITTLTISRYTQAGTSPERNHSVPTGMQGYAIIINDMYVYNGKFLGDRTKFAMTLTHEGFHAKIKSSIQIGGGIDNFPSYKQFDTDGDGKLNVHEEHEYIATYGRGTLIEAAKQYDTKSGTLHTEEWYQAMSWSGLIQTDAWSEFASANPELAERYQALQENEVNYARYQLYVEKRAAGNEGITTDVVQDAKNKVNWKTHAETRKSK